MNRDNVLSLFKGKIVEDISYDPDNRETVFTFTDGSDVRVLGETGIWMSAKLWNADDRQDVTSG